MKQELEELLEKLDLEPEELAGRLGVTGPILRNLMSGRVKSSPQLLKIQNALGAFKEGFSREFVMTYVLVDKPISFRRMIDDLAPRTIPSGGHISPDSSPDPDSSGDGEHLMGDMERASLDAFGKGHYIQCALILFQAIETLIRVLINTYAERLGVSESAIREAAAKEQSFLRLTLHLDLVFPGNGLTKELRRLNRTRNDTMHRLFYEFETRREMEEKLRAFCQEALVIRDRLAHEVHRRLPGVGGLRSRIDSDE